MDAGLMQDRHVSLTGVTAAALWMLSVVLVVAGALTDVSCGDLGIVAGLAAVTLTIRGYFVDLADRERNAFEIGRDSVRRTR